MRDALVFKSPGIFSLFVAGLFLIVTKLYCSDLLLTETFDVHSIKLSIKMRHTGKGEKLWVPELHPLVVNSPSCT